LILFMRTEREMKALGGLHNCQILKTYNYTIDGIDSLRAFDKTQWCHSTFMQDLYNSTVWKCNYKFIYTGMSILCEVSSLCVIGAAAIFAINSKFDNEVEDVALISASITFSLRLTGAMTSIIKDCVSLELAMKGSSKKNFDVIDKNPIISEDNTKPLSWPSDNSIQFEKVSLGYEGLEDLVVKDIDLSVKSGENIVICGRDGSGKSSLLSAICGLLRPVKNFDGKMGCIKVAG
jgi:ATP-binding cassette subfamily C (CFTR/MRP) protein 1